jgi:hypothetical protein
MVSPLPVRLRASSVSSISSTTRCPTVYAPCGAAARHAGPTARRTVAVLSIVGVTPR